MATPHENAIAQYHGSVDEELDAIDWFVDALVGDNNDPDLYSEARGSVIEWALTRYRRSADWADRIANISDALCEQDDVA
jgi:hypothetical protein